jgi:hypothetical protein
MICTWGDSLPYNIDMCIHGHHSLAYLRLVLFQIRVPALAKNKSGYNKGDLLSVPLTLSRTFFGVIPVHLARLKPSLR